MINYIAKYIYFIKTLKKNRENNTWLDHYINWIEINQRFINIIVNKDFNLIQIDQNY